MHALWFLAGGVALGASLIGLGVFLAAWNLPVDGARQKKQPEPEIEIEVPAFVHGHEEKEIANPQPQDWDQAHADALDTLRAIASHRGAFLVATFGACENPDCEYPDCELYTAWIANGAQIIRIHERLTREIIAGTLGLKT